VPIYKIYNIEKGFESCGLHNSVQGQYRASEGGYLEIIHITAHGKIKFWLSVTAFYSYSNEAKGWK